MVIASIGTSERSNRALRIVRSAMDGVLLAVGHKLSTALFPFLEDFMEIIDRGLCNALGELFDKVTEL